MFSCVDLSLTTQHHPKISSASFQLEEGVVLLRALGRNSPLYSSQFITFKGFLMFEH